MILTLTDVDESMDLSAVATTGDVTDAEGDVDLFTIDRRTGQITVRPGKSFDYSGDATEGGNDEG